MKILIVEDEEDILQLLTVIFDDVANHGVVYARDGEEALRLARENSPDIVLLDVQLPKLTGYEVCKQIKSDPIISATKVLMLSGMTQDLDLRKSREAGADGQINKPFRAIDLIEQVEKLARGI